MSMEVCGDEGGVFWWEWDDRGLPASGSSAVYATYHSTMSPDGHQFSVVRADYSWLANRNVVLCDGGKIGASVEANKDHQGTSHGEVKASIEKKTENDTTFRVDVHADIRQDKDGNVQTGAGVRASIQTEF